VSRRWAFISNFAFSILLLHYPRQSCALNCPGAMARLDHFLNSKFKGQDERRSWNEDNLTSPHDYKNDPYHFRFLTYSVEGGTADDKSWFMALQVVHSQVQQKYGKPNDYDPQVINVLEEPDKISEKRVISASLIDQNHKATWGSSGFLLTITPSNVVATHTHDAGTDTYMGQIAPSTAQMEKERLFEKYGIGSPQNLLNNSSTQFYNEVVLQGTGDDGQKIQITGIFIKVKKGRSKLSNSLLGYYRQLSAKYGWPIVYIYEE